MRFFTQNFSISGFFKIIHTFIIPHLFIKVKFNFLSSLYPPRISAIYASETPQWYLKFFTYTQIIQT